ncbi:hypothetical protein OR1_00289 [Geobacter sp. OR-1]|uniref:hypothetical protein n=1 Tax=Geobacter sp. OR-1 TaxID=1266765 RepID=UPI000543E614|nr:hypothetical protein [Geobacter sp. OR-1]GAM08019.1 hypothetical protein OR1_00289 [Geobacter sp. OR-1]
MSIINDFIKRELLRINRLLDTLQALHLVTITKEDLIRFRGTGYHREIHFSQEGNDRIAELVSRNEPLLVARLGSVELSCLHFYLEKRRGADRRYSGKIKATMANPAGFFPVDDASLDAFAELYLEHLPQVDAMGVWFNPYEDVICNTYCGKADLVDFDSLEPFRFGNPWSSRLAGRKVLVVHPFSESIQKQYTEKRRLLFSCPDVLPEFELKTLKTVQSIAGSRVDFATWFDAYRHMCDGITKIDFDICIIGAGAYGLPLAAFAKQLGKQAIHLGGVTQILFGIKGKRWEREYADSTAKLFNEHWVRPLPTETPANKDKIERGCYW